MTTGPELRARFGDRPAIFTVVHVLDVDQALRNVEVSLVGEADGVWLINHHQSHDHLLATAITVRSHHPDLWMGVNCLGVEPTKVFGILPDGIDAVWTDDGGIDETSAGFEVSRAEAIRTAIDDSGWDGLWFGGVAFKYQAPISDVGGAAKAASVLLDVICSSGPGTGHAADVDKLAALRAGAGDAALAVASGFDASNAHEQLRYIDAALVATSVSSAFDELDPDKVADLVRCAR